MYVILTAFPPQQWLHERFSVLRRMYIACLVTFWKTGKLVSKFLISENPTDDGLTRVAS